MAKKKTEPHEISVDDLMLAELRTANHLLAILATRGMDQREAIALLHGMSFSPRAIAAALSITPNAVSIAIYRMKKAEQPALQKTGDGAAIGEAAISEVEQNG